MKKIILGFVLGVGTIVVFASAFIVAGGMPVATRGNPLPLERLIAKIALNAALRGSDQLVAPFAANEAAYLAGAKVYRAQCAVCHSLPGESPGPIAQGLFPKPPRLFAEHHGVVGVSDDSAGETYWKVKNGIRLTGMPGFEKGLTDDEIWQVSLLLKNADKLPKSVQDFLAAKIPASP
ncbi:MAG: cytochrome c [Oligoflexia bacterium]|nr:cytochrome c [Oligoflexia bacterium]